MKTYTVVIIGCGSIGALKPNRIDSLDSVNILTHCHAVYKHPRAKLMGIIDTDIEKAKAASEKWRTLYRTDLKFTTGPDIVIVAVPTKNHYNLLLNLLDPKLISKLVITEKPFCTNFTQAKTISSIYKENKIPILVDYIRRFAPGYKEIKKQIDSGVFGKAQNARVLYGRGLKHESCHAIDLMRYFFGECFACDTLLAPAPIDKDESDPSLSVYLAFKKCSNVIFQACDSHNYGIFEIDICFEKGRLRFIDNGLYVEKYPIVEENEWGHKSLGYKLTSVIRQETGLNVALYNLIDNAVKFLDGEEDLICTAEDAVKVHSIIESLK